MEHEYPVLRHALDKVRYFRNVLYGDDMRVRIVVGHGATGKTASLNQAIADVELGPNPANQLCVLSCMASIPQLPVKEPRSTVTAILVYIRWSLDPFVEALLAEYGEENCEIVIFKQDLTLNSGGLY